jgi:hypothetical protein
LRIMQHFARRTPFAPFRRFLGDVRRKFMQRLSDALYGCCKQLKSTY